MQAGDICGIQSPLICFGVNREIFSSKILQSDFLEVILVTEWNLSCRHSPWRSGKNGMEVRRGFLTTPSGLSSCELISYHPNLLFRQIKLKFPLPEFTFRNLFLENSSTSQKVSSHVQYSTMARRADVGTRLGLTLALPIISWVPSGKYWVGSALCIFTSKILSAPTSDVF